MALLTNTTATAPAVVGWVSCFRLKDTNQYLPCALRPHSPEWSQAQQHWDVIWKLSGSEDSQTSLSVVYHLSFTQLIFESKFCVRKILAVIAVSQRHSSCPQGLLVQHCPAELSVVTEMVCLIGRLNVASVTKELDLKFLVLTNVNSNL